MFAASNTESLLAEMTRELGTSDVKAIPAKPVKTIWAFTGQGASCLGAGRCLFDAYATFRDDLGNRDFLVS